MKERNRWILIVFCGLMIASALHSAWRRHQYAMPEVQPREPAPVRLFAPRQRPPSEHNIARELNKALADAVEKVMPSVVVIRTEKPHLSAQALDPFGLYYKIVPDQLLGEGSGVIIDDRGYVMTSWHVIDEGVQHIEVVFNDGTKMPAKEVGHDEVTDLAVLKIIGDSHEFPAVEFGNSDALRIGDMVIAIGSPFSLQSSVTVGHVSQKGRRMKVLTYEDFIQTDAAINEGNSGGPLIDVDGRLVGINAAILAKGAGIAFAVPANLAAVVASSLIQDGVHQWPWVGATFSTSRDPSGKRACVANVWRDTPAARAGMLVGDVVLAVNGKPVKDEYDVNRIIYNHSVGESVRFLTERSGKKQPEIELLLEEYPGKLY